MIENLTTEKRNVNSENLDLMNSLELVTVMNNEDKKVAIAIEKILPDIALAIEIVSNKIKTGGRLIYIGAGTSGRLGILDAVECVPTFGVDSSEILGIIAGGEEAFIHSVEGAEDSYEFAINDLKKINLNSKDVLIGIAASGRTPYVISAIQYGNKVNASTISIACNKNSEISKHSNISIEVDVGAEILTGSTRLKAGSAQKMILNMISTGSMVKCGKVYGNLMVDVKTTNEKLVDRCNRIVMSATGVDRETANLYLEKSKYNAKIAMTMILGDYSYDEAVEKLNNSDGFVRKAIEKG